MISVFEALKRSASKQTPRQNLSSLGPSISKVWGQRGLLSGQSIEWVGPQYCGKTGLLRTWVEELYQRGMCIAWIDPSASIEPDAFTTMGSARFWMVRPPSEQHVFVCVEMIIRSGCFDVLVIEHSSTMPWQKIRRIQHLAKVNDLVLIWNHSDLSQPLSGQVAHRIRVSGLPSGHLDRLSEWSAMQLRVSAKNVKYDEMRSSKIERRLYQACSLPLSLTRECPDRSTADRDQHLTDTLTGV